MSPIAKQPSQEVVIRITLGTVEASFSFLWKWIGIQEHSYFGESTIKLKVFERKKKIPTKVTIELFFNSDLNQNRGSQLYRKTGKDYGSSIHLLRNVLAVYESKRIEGQLLVRLNNLKNLMKITLTSNRFFLLLRRKLRIRILSSAEAIDFSYSLDNKSRIDCKGEFLFLIMGLFNVRLRPKDRFALQS